MLSSEALWEYRALDTAVDVLLPHQACPDSLPAALPATLDYLLSLQLPSGNFPSSLAQAHSDRLVHWCHGAPGFVHLMSQAYQVHDCLLVDVDAYNYMTCPRH